ncbi:sensor domain-containing phosphodiesterase [Salmonella enterica]|nr:sensor domain-containing phosphodiesterase [Salmonella enterica]ECK6795310.1 sensor domain-containing phosphodiesterase [Salmonella enterica]EGT9486512.1 sensor domain-containing phosphodiesterase [Salmonella enterica]EJF6442102.1 sensor domain-containing phosphodiesterase [Salmonella enterica]
MPDKCNVLKNIKIFLLAFCLTVPAILLSRLISPRATIDSSYIFLAWLPLCVMFSVLFLFGRRGVAPMVGGMMLTNEWNFHLPLPQAMVLLFCQTFPVLLVCAIVRWQLGARWRYGIPNQGIWLRVFWLGLMTPFGIKISMHLAGHYLAFPVTISTFFGTGTAIFSIVDLLSLISAALIFTLFFYYPLRMIVSPHYMRIFWRRDVAPYLAKEKRLFTLLWFATLATLLAVLCTPFETKYIAGYLVPVLFIGFTIGVGKISYPLLNFSWALTALFLLSYNRNFLQGVGSEYSLAFILSVLISFSICLLYMARINQRSEWLNRQWHSQALTDPLTQLPNLRALEQFLLQDAGQSVCYLRMENLEFLSRHYGMQMRVHCEREVFRMLQPLLLEKEKIFHLPGSELLLVLTGPETEARLQYMLNVLNNRKIYWNNTGLDMEYGASWGTFDGRQETLQPLLGQLSWLAEQSCSHRRVLALTQSIEAASGQTTERVLRLQKIRQALERGALVLYAQPIRDAQGKGYDEILTRLRCDDGIMMPLTLLQKETASRIMQLFKRYGVPPASVIIEITEEQAFSHSEISMHNINQLRKFGLKIAIDDFGTGYANYERLKRLKADIIKIDGCFVKDILTDSLDAMIVKSITDLAKAKSLSVVAEFVETPAQRDLLLQLGVHSLQGYLIGRPRPLGK